MVFSSLFFIFLFLPVVLFFYYLIPSRTWKNLILILSSLLFYAWGEPVWVSLLVFSAVIDYFHGLIAQRHQGRWQSKLAVASSLILNLSLLAVFKYMSMFVETFNALSGLNIQYHSFSLPIGISFYTFQTISYVIDVYQGKAEAQRSFLKFFMYVSLFHQLVAGPIVRYKDIAREIEERVFQLSVFSEGIKRFVIGLSKKVVLANTAGEVAKNFLDQDYAQMSMAGFWAGMFLFAFQIYYDFSGYSDMAIGLGKMFGFTYKENFNYPYISKSATEFWRRWHISLGTFFRECVYIPLGGNRKHPLRNILIVWFLTGLWHGASWNFVLWGMYYGVLLIIEKNLGKLRVFYYVPNFIKHLYLIIITIFGWTLFYFEDLNQGLLYMKGLLRYQEVWDLKTEIILMNNSYFFIVAALFATPLVPKIVQGMKGFLYQLKLRVLYDTLLYPFGLGILFVISSMLLVGQSYNPFLYFRF